jgi:hypothetical protein
MRRFQQLYELRLADRDLFVHYRSSQVLVVVSKFMPRIQGQVSFPSGQRTPSRTDPHPSN